MLTARFAAVSFVTALTLPACDAKTGAGGDDEGEEEASAGEEEAQFVYRTRGQERVGEVVDVHLACE